MSDNGSIIGSVTEGLKDIGKDALKQVFSAPSDTAKAALQQTVGKNESPEEELKKKQEQAKAHARMMEIDAEIQQIRQQNEQKRMQEATQQQGAPQQKLQTLQEQQKTQDEASRQAVGKSEQGRNYKG